MSWRELVEELDRRDIALSWRDGRLSYQAPAGAVDGRLRELLAPCRERLVETLTGAGAAESAAPAGIAQQRMHLAHGRVVDPSLWNINLRIALRGPLRPDALAGALSDLVARHHSLRTRFAVTELGLLQQVLPARPVPLPVTDLAEAAVTEPEGHLAAAVAAMTAASFDLTEPPLLRAELLRSGPEDWVLLLSVHHIALDGWALATVLADLGHCYRKRIGDDVAELPVVDCQMTDHALWERTVVTRESVRAAARRLTERLAGLPLALPLPTDRPRPPQRSGAGGMAEFRLEAPLARAVHRYATRHSATPAAVLLAALGELLGRLTGSPEALVMLAHANRGRREHEQLVGLLAANLPIRLATRPDALPDRDRRTLGGPGADGGFGALVAAARDGLADAMDHAAVPFGLLLEPLREAGVVIPAQFPQIILGVQSIPPAGLELPGVTAEIEDIPGDGARADLSILLTPDQDGYAGEVEYDAGLFDPATVHAWLAELRAILTGHLLGAAESD
ncbi:condensation domain-containing protein [Kitasatospora sp. HPMI-4]|uniref:condensation domain-containing protein n=1 Tax=Kitasatospora sp. HPMI-4 TaxID=3448443 RepID=UPI003F194571